MRSRKLRIATLVTAAASFIAAAAVVAIRRYPTAEECAASGRTVDATFRHCESEEGFVELREHVYLHVRDAAYYVVVLGISIGAVVYAIRRRRSNA